MKLENQFFSLHIDESTGALSSLVVKALQCDLIGEQRLRANFRLLLPLKKYEANYIDGMAQRPESIRQDGQAITVSFAGVKSDLGKFAVALSYTVALEEDAVVFRAALTNHEKQPVAEFWFPQIGGITDLGGRRDGRLALPEYTNCGFRDIFTRFPVNQCFAEPAEWSCDYPTGSMSMPWCDLHDPTTDVGLYLGYHDVTCRYSSWHLHLHPTASGRLDDPWLKPHEAAGQPIGLVFSHVRYPYIHSGETFQTGEFILRAHPGDWHEGGKYYRRWFDRHWKIDKSQSWLRKKSAWFTCILQQPEDRVVANYETYGQWCADAGKHGIDCCELIGWDKGGLERGYPYYVPEEKLGGREAFRRLLKSIDARGGKCLVFANYNVLDSDSEEYHAKLRPWTHQEFHGSTSNWMSWGYGTLSARKNNHSRRHVLSSVLPELNQLLGDLFEQIVRDGAHGMQIDKVCVGSRLDFNPLNTLKPDVAMCEGLIVSLARIYQRLKAVDPDFCLASEATHDRLIPFVDVFYRNSNQFNISPLRYVFPEWTSCQHVLSPRDFDGVNGAVLTGSVICVEPEMYRSTLANPLWHDMARYIQEVERLRRELADIIFLGRYHDTLGATVVPVGSPDPLVFRVHGHWETDRRAIAVANQTGAEIEYHWKFLHKAVGRAMLYQPFQPVQEVRQEQPLHLKGGGLQVLVEAE